MRKLQLIHLYCFVCQCYDNYPCLHFQRMSNNSSPVFTDQEVLTIYLFGTLQRQFLVSHIYEYIEEHWLEWFPQLPSYQAFNYRLNQLYWQMELMCSLLLTQTDYSDAYGNVHVLDSMPIILSKHPYQAKVAHGVADKGYCPSKDLYYHGVKFHLLAADIYRKLPKPQAVGFTAASINDWTAAKEWCYQLENTTLFADKIYGSQSDRQVLEKQGVHLFTPVKHQKGQTHLQAADKQFSRWVSSIRQPIESLFEWIDHKTKLQNASHVRSEKGLYLHCWGKLATALFLIVFYP